MIEARKPGPLAADKVVVIAREDDGGRIADQLERAGVIDSAMWFNVVTLLDGNRGALKARRICLQGRRQPARGRGRARRPRVVQYKLTIPEGLTSDQIVAAPARQRRSRRRHQGASARGLAAARDLLSSSAAIRGEPMLARMAKAQAKAVDEIWKRRAPDLPIKSPGELVTLASIVEKETGKADERPRVAGVFVNRLEKRMKLESDPTIVYGLVFGKGTLGRSITKADLNQSTPYNTYIIDGLPPGPISNPGKAALEAVANPSRTKDLYFVADGTGGHVFAETLDQHQKNVAHWRQIEKDAKDRLAPDVTPQPAPAIRGAIDPVDPSRSARSSRRRRDNRRRRRLSPVSSEIGADRKAQAAALASLVGAGRSNRSTRSAGSSPASTTGRRKAPRSTAPIRRSGGDRAHRFRSRPAGHARG